MQIDIIDNSELVLSELEKKIEKALEECGNHAVTNAKQNIERAGRIDTGTMINSVTHQVETGESAVYVGTNVEYAVYNEVGTIKMAPIHFLRNSISDHIPQYEGIIEKNLKSD